MVISYKRINDVNEIKLNNRWQDKSLKDEILIEKFSTTPGTTNFNQYRIIRKEKNYTNLEILKRALKGIWIVIRSFGTKLRSKQVKDLFAKKKTKLFGLLIGTNQNSLGNNQVTNNQTTLNLSFEHLIKKGSKFHLFNRLGRDLDKHIFTFLDTRDLVQCTSVSKNWLSAADSLIPPIGEGKVYGKEKWEKLGDIGKVPRLPLGIKFLMKGPCPFTPDKSVEETHTLFLIPEKLNGKPLTLNFLIEKFELTREREFNNTELPSNIKGRQGLRIRKNQKILNKFGKLRIKSHWVLIKNTIIQESAYDIYFPNNILAAHKKILTKYPQYDFPSVRDAILSTFIKCCHINNKDFCHTICKEVLLANKDPKKEIHVSTGLRFFSDLLNFGDVVPAACFSLYGHLEVPIVWGGRGKSLLGLTPARTITN